ncbi:UDP-N-acetylmuramoyl-L-alanine--D-glutamate ligase [Oceanospirillum sp. D5]|uniref:UDP-N-acetylmuramoylalanine--D-glutamate ligase n=2 Tax=Oceanospirillum sediminis TaxID=2760088 RepID=A0A839IJH3_9GAMM|nr:UDP-N-acetylmuramoyl-L-alanine--D-glutamate ligase [Oceanospirillum sediminis]
MTLCRTLKGGWILPHSVIIGLGQTGLSCARYLADQGVAFAVADTRFRPPGLEQFEQAFPDTEIWLGPLDAGQLCEAQELVVSPGVAISEPAICLAAEQGVSIVGDIELFARAVSVPIIAITGSNAKSTVTSLVAQMAERSGINVGMGGNIGVPALELLKDSPKDLYVLELSSFQLETTHSLKAQVACILNISPDHMDRYPDVLEYTLAKQRVYAGCEYAVVNRSDEATLPVHGYKTGMVGFGTDQPESGEFGVVCHEGKEYLALGHERLIAVDDITLTGRHGQENALAALAIGQCAGFSFSAMLEALRSFQGLAHRCQLAGSIDGVNYINDSKGTNVGATVAALNGLGPGCAGKLILIAGGDGKGADFGDLAEPVQSYCREVVLLGRDGPQIEAILPDGIAFSYAADMQDAVIKARAVAEPEDLVLLSPACASFDMFSGYAARGDAFVSAVKELSLDC